MYSLRPFENAKKEADSMQSKGMHDLRESRTSTETVLRSCMPVFISITTRRFY